MHAHRCTLDRRMRSWNHCIMALLSQCAARTFCVRTDSALHWQKLLGELGVLQAWQVGASNEGEWHMCIVLVTRPGALASARWHWQCSQLEGPRFPRHWCHATEWWHRRVICVTIRQSYYNRAWVVRLPDSLQIALETESPTDPLLSDRAGEGLRPPEVDPPRRREARPGRDPGLVSSS